MIFRTINADAKKLTEQFGLLNKSFRDIKKDFANGLGFKNSLFQTSISKTDYQALQKFNSAIKVTNDGLTKSQRITKAWNENMSGCSIAAKRMGNDLVTGKKNIQDISKAMNTASGSTKALGVAMNVMANVGFMLAITVITKVISELAQAQDNAAQAAKEATETYKSELDSIADYKQRLSELHEELKSGNLSYEETKTKRTELMTIQDELIEKFGTEKSAIESVTDAVKGQVDALDNLNEKAYRDWVAKADEQTFWNKFLPGGKSGLDQAIDYMETEKTVSFMDMQNANLSDELQAIQKEIDETIRAKYNLDKTFAMFNVTGTPEEIKSQLEAIRQDYIDLSKNLFLENGISSEMWEEYRKEAIDSINEAINKFDKGLEEHQKTYQTYIEGMIKYDSEYSDEYATILQKRAELESAQNSGNKEEIKQARQNFMDAINDGIEASGSNENIKKYFQSLYPELQAEFSNWNFEFSLEANTDGLADTAKEVGEKYTATDLLGMIDDESAVIADSAFNSLIDKAIEYGICTDKSADEVQKLIDLLVELGIVQDNVKGDTFNIENPISFDQAWADSYTSESDVVKELADNLLELAEKGRLTKESFAQTDSTNYFKNLGISTDEALLKINKLVDESKQLSSMASQLSSISDVLGIKRDDGFVSADTLAGFDVEVRGLDSWDRFQEVLGSTASSYGECQEAANALATEWVNSSDFLAQLTEKNKKYYETQLQAMGVENYEEVIAYAQELNSAKEALAQAGFDVATATEEEIQALIKEGTYSELAQQQIWNLVLTKQAEEGITLDTSADCQNLLALAQNAGITGTAIELLAELLEIYNNLAAGTYGTNAQVINAVKNKAESLKNQINAIFANGVNSDTVELDPEIKVGSSASKAGKAAGDTYVEAFEEELKSLQDLRDRGVIDEAVYLQRLRALYTRYFADRKEYINQFNEYERQYLDGMKSLYDSALSGVSKLMSHQIDGYTEAKEAAVASLEAEKEARLEAIEAQKEQLEAEQDLIDERIDAKQELIDGIQKEIDAMKDARAERQRQLDLQKAQYELESMKNQRTILLYSREKGMHYVADDSAVRDAQEKVDDAEFDIKVSQKENEIKLIEQEIDLLEEQKEAIQDQIDALDGQAERIEEYYSKMIAETEKYYDSLISNTEKQKSKWEELAEVEEIAQAYSAMKQVFGDMGYTVQDILNGNEQAFEDFKSKYISLLNDMNNNANFAEGLSYATGISEENLGSFLGKTKDAGAGIDELSSKSSSLGIVAEGMDGIANSASNANTQITDTAANVGNVVANVGELSTHLGTVSTLVSDEQAAFDALRQTIANVIDAIDQKTQAMLNEQVVTGIAVTTEIAYFTLLKEKILELQECISNINLAVMTLDRTPIDNLTDAFHSLYDQILLVSTTLGIGGGNQETSALGSITSALQALNEISLEKGIITQLANLQTAIIGVAAAISGGGEAPDGKGYGESASLPEGKADGKGAGKGGSNSLTSAITQMGTTASEVIGEPDAEGDGTVIGEFGSMKTAVTDVTTSIGNGDSEGTEELNNDSADEGDGTLIDSIVSLGDTTKEVLGEPGGDGVIGRFEQFKQPISDADNHVQSIARGLEDIDGQQVECTIKIHVESDGSLPGGGILKSTMNTESGEYTADYGSTHPTKQTTGTITTSSGLKLQPIRPGDNAWTLQEAFAPLLQEMQHHLAASAMYEQRRQTEQTLRDITAANMIYNSRNIQPAIHGGVHITCPGITSQEVARQVGAELNHMFNGLHNYADQQSSIR